MSHIDSYRRKFLGGLAGTAAVATVAPGVFLREVQAKPADQAVTDKVRWGMLIDTSKLTDGGDACVEACTAENHEAMTFGDLNDENSIISRQLKEFGGKEIRADLGLNTGVRYRGL